LISQPYFWTIVFCLAIGTFAIRFSIIAISSRIKISDRTKELFSFIPAAILPAFIAPAVFFHQGQVAWAGGKERLLVLILATIVSFLTRSTFATIGFGLVTLYLVTQL
jgi:branched-subunit amino acid transport protein